ncbi:MAG: hypothetical protein P0111_03345 [Nitrospira sp.]|nr:hypothetical protein [Nitrospira sp.]
MPPLRHALPRIAIACLLLVGGCAGDSSGRHKQTSDIEIGTTTKADVLKRYGGPDFEQLLPDGEIATYRPSASPPPKPTVSVPTVQTGPLETMTTQSQTVDPRFGKGTGPHHRPQTELQIRYDQQGIVRELIQ